MRNVWLKSVVISLLVTSCVGGGGGGADAGIELAPTGNAPTGSSPTGGGNNSGSKSTNPVIQGSVTFFKSLSNLILPAAHASDFVEAKFCVVNGDTCDFLGSAPIVDGKYSYEINQQYIDENKVIHIQIVDDLDEIVRENLVILESSEILAAPINTDPFTTLNSILSFDAVAENVKNQRPVSEIKNTLVANNFNSVREGLMESFSIGENKSDLEIKQLMGKMLVETNLRELLVNSKNTLRQNKISLLDLQVKDHKKDLCTDRLVEIKIQNDSLNNEFYDVPVRSTKMDKNIDSVSVASQFDQFSSSKSMLRSYDNSFSSNDMDRGLNLDRILENGFSEATWCMIESAKSQTDSFSSGRTSSIFGNIKSPSDIQYYYDHNNQNNYYYNDQYNDSYEDPYYNHHPEVARANTADDLEMIFENMVSNKTYCESLIQNDDQESPLAQEVLAYYSSAIITLEITIDQYSSAYHDDHFYSLDQSQIDSTHEILSTVLRSNYCK